MQSSSDCSKARNRKAAKTSGSLQNPDSVFCKMLLNQENLHPNVLTRSISRQIQNFRKNFFPKTRRKPCHVAMYNFILSCIIELPSPENCLLPHAQAFSSRIFLLFLWCVSTTQWCNLCSCSFCVFMFNGRYSRNSTFIGKTQS